MKNALILTAAILLASAASAQAQQAAPIKKFYAGLDYVGTSAIYDTIAGVDGDQLYPDSFPGYNPYVGYRFNENFAVELGYFATSEKSKTFHSSLIAPLSPAMPVTTSVSYSNYYVDAVGRYPIFEPLALIGSVGLSWLNADVSATALNTQVSSDESAIAFRFGAGLETELVNSLNLRTSVRYIMPTGNDISLWQYGIGLNYGF